MRVSITLEMKAGYRPAGAKVRIMPRALLDAAAANR